MVSLNKKWVGVSLGVAIALTASACSSPSSDAGSTSGQSDYIVYLSLGLTGPVSGVAKANVAAMQVAVDAVNSEGGIQGRQVDLVVQDDQLDPTKAATLLQDQLDKGPIDLAIAGSTSNVALALVPILNRNKVISISQPGSDKLNDPSTYPYAFGLTVTNQLDAQSMVEKVEELGDKKAALLAGNDANGQSTSTAYATEFEKAGIDLVQESYAPTDLDVTSQLQRLQAENPDVLLIQGFGAITAHILEGRTKLGWDIPTLGTASIANGNNLGLISTADEWNNLDLMAFPANTTQSTTTTRPAFETLMSGLKAANVTLDQTMQQYTGPWDSLYLAKQAAEQAKSTDADQVARALEDLDAIQGDSPLLTFATETFSADNHFLDLSTSEAYVWTKPGPIVDGVIQPVG